MSGDPFSSGERGSSGDQGNLYAFDSRQAIPINDFGVGSIRQVPTLAILMAVQGGLTIAYGLMMVALGFVMPYFMRMSAANAGNMPGGAQPFPAEMEWFMVIIYGGMGLLFLALGGFTVFSGLRLYRFQSRVMGMVSLGVGLMSLFNCYCFPTAIGLAIYGFIVLTKPAVMKAFEIAQGGSMTADELVGAVQQRIRDGLLQ
jgi:hypothetical protein